MAVEDILTETLSATIREWFEPKFYHPFLNVNIVSVPNATKTIPHRWVEDVQIDDLFIRGDEFDPFAAGGTNSTLNLQDGKQRLKMALQRLDLSEETVCHTNLDRMKRHEFAIEKRRVKQELKRYDAEFRKQFGRLPTHTEKEPMRPLYVYYRRLKTCITQVEQNKLGRGSRSTSGRGDDLRFEPRESMTTIPDLDEGPQVRDSQNKAAVEDQISALEVRIENLQCEKAAVRAKLQTFQEKFVARTVERFGSTRTSYPLSVSIGCTKI